MCYLISLSVTLLLELPVAWCFGLRGRDLVLVILVNCLTNPLVVLCHGWLEPWGPWLHTVIPEILALVAEAAIYCWKGRSIPRPLTLSVCSNLLSYSLGQVLQWIL